MSIITDAKAGTAGTVNPIVDHLLDRLDASIAEAVGKLGPEADALASDLQAAVQSTRDALKADIPAVAQSLVGIAAEYDVAFLISISGRIGLEKKAGQAVTIQGVA